MAPEKPENPPAFPLGVPHMTEYQPEWGMSLRDYFAGQALAGLMGNPEIAKAMGQVARDAGMAESAAYAKASFQTADAMLASRLSASGEVL